MLSKETCLTLVLLSMVHAAISSTEVVMLKGKDINIYVKQHESFFVSDEFQHGVTSSPQCTFIPKHPDLSRAYSKDLKGSLHMTGQQALVQSLRSTQETGTQDMIVLTNYIFILGNDGFVTTFGYNSSVVLGSHNYRIDELTWKATPFKYNEEVIFIVGDRIIRCSEIGYHSVPFHSQQLGTGVQVSPTQFVVAAGNSLKIYTQDQNHNFSVKAFIENSRITERYPAVKEIHWVKCRKESQTQLFCLEHFNGVFVFIISTGDFNLTQKRPNCHNFIMSVSRSMVASCIYHSQNYHINPSLNEDKIKPAAFFARDIFPLKSIGDYYVAVSKSAIHFMNARYSEYDYKMEFKEKITRVVPWYGTNESGTRVIDFYVLFKNRLVKYLYRPGKNRVDCKSDTALSKQIDLTLTLPYGEVQQMPIHFTAKDIPKGHSIKGGLFVVLGGSLLFAALIIFAIVCYYRKLEERLQRIYKNIKQRTKKKANVVQEAP